MGSRRRIKKGIRNGGWHLSTTLILTYFFVALLAVVAAGAVALPLLQHYQDDQFKESQTNTLLEASRGYDNLQTLLANRSSTTNPFVAYMSLNVTNVNTARRWPDTPPIDVVRQKFNDLAASSEHRLLIITQNDQVVQVDTESNAQISLQGQKLPEVKIPATASQLPFQITITTASGHKINLIYRGFSGVNKPNLFGLTNARQPLPLIVAEEIPLPVERDVWGDLALILIVAALAALAISLIAGFLLARSLSHPLVKLTDATHAVARGDYQQRVVPQGGQELKRLAESFNQMTHNVAEAHRMQRQLIADVSHELKTPLTSIQGFSQAMLDGALRRPEDFVRPAEIISHETARMIRLVNGLLELSKLESGQAGLNLRQIDLAELLTNCVDSFQPRARSHKVSLQLEAKTALPLVGDSDRLRQVFNNLIDNALKYTDPNGRIIVKAGQEADNIVASVSDTGAGIPAVDVPHIFERFYQADKSRRRDLAEEGSGLGLAICKEIIISHNGKIEAASQQGQGTTFTITLPALPTSAQITTRTPIVTPETVPLKS